MITAQSKDNILDVYFLITNEYDNTAESSDIFKYLLQKIHIFKNKLVLFAINKSIAEESVIKIQQWVRRYLCKEKYEVFLRFKEGRRKILYRTGKIINLMTLMITVIQSLDNIIIDICGGCKASLKVPYILATRKLNYKCIASCIEMKENNVTLNSNLLAYYNKQVSFTLPIELKDYEKLFEKWKEIDEDYCRIMILQHAGKFAITIDSDYRIMSKQEILEIYHEISLECIYEEITLKNSQIFLDTNVRHKPILILSRKYPLENSFISVTLRDKTNSKIEKVNYLAFDITIKDLHTRISLELNIAEEKTGIPSKYLLPLSNYLIDKALIISGESIHLDLNIPKCNINKIVTDIQRMYRGFLVRTNVGKIKVKGNNFLAAVQRRKVSGTEVMLFAYIQYGKIRIEAIDKDYRLVLYLDQDFIQNYGEMRKKIIEGIIFSNLYISNTNGSRRLCINTSVHASRKKELKKMNSKDITEEIFNKVINFEGVDYNVSLIRMIPGILIIAKSNNREYRMEIKAQIPKYLDKVEISKLAEEIYSQIVIENNTLKLKKKFF